LTTHAQHLAANELSAATGHHLTDRLPLPVVKLKPRAQLPEYKSAEAAGMDLSACLDEGEVITLGSLDRRLVPTGLALAIPVGFEGQVRPRSGWALKEGVTLLNSPGTIDSDYRGEVGVIVVNLSTQPVHIRHGDRIAQLVIAPVSRVMPVSVEQLDETQRGAGGFGHTGRR
jgi:dUTP pyrophosphatase